MLGLGNSLTSTSVIGGPLPMAISQMYATDSPDSEKIALGIVVSSTDPLVTLQGISSASEGDKLSGTYSLKIERYTDLIANGGSVAATATATVFAYRFSFNESIVGTGVNQALSYISDDDESNIDLDNFLQEGSALINIKSFGGTDLTGGASDGVNLLYVFTLTVSGAGYLDAVKATSEVTITT